MAYDEATLRNEVLNANDGDIIEITDDIHLSGTISITKVITIQSDNDNSFTIFHESTGRHFVISPSGAGGSLTLKNLILDGQGTGGGVYVGPNCTFTMEDGSIIRGCVSNEYGGGVYIVEGSFIMNGGEISDCRSAGGGGVFLNYLAGGPPRDSIVMNGGKISGCSAPFGGGILLLNTVNVTTVNTVVTGNFSGTYGGGIGILTGSLSKINTSLVSGNTAQLSEGPDAQIYVYSDHYYSGNEYTFVDYNSSSTIVILLNGEARNLTFFKVRDNNTGEYLVAFCSEWVQDIDDHFPVYFLPNVWLSREQMNKIAITIRAALGGERFYDVVEGDAELSVRAYVAQYIIWNIEAGYHRSDELITTIERIRTALGNSAADCLDEIVSAIRRFENQTLPSFAGSTFGSAAICYLEYSRNDDKYKVTLTDTNGVLRYFTVDPGSLPQGLNVTLDYNNNTMTILCDDKSILEKGTVLIRLISLFEGGDASVYFHPLYQDLVIPDNRYEIMIDAYVKPLISKPKPTPKKPCPCYSKSTKCRKSIIGHKIWIDNNNKDNTRPPTAEILLLRDGELYKSIIIDSSDEDAFIFCCVQIGKKPGHRYDYQIDEANVPRNYTKTIEGNNVINTLNP